MIRRHVLTACEVKKTDPSFAGDVSNALQSLKVRGVVARQGTMWSLSDAEV